MKKKKAEENGQPPEFQAEQVEFLRNAVSYDVHDDEASKTWPHVFQLLVPRYKDGALTRQEGSIMLTVRGGRWHVRLEAPTERIKGTFAFVRLSTFLDSLEAAIAGDGVAWEEHYKKRTKDLNRVAEAVK